MAHRLIVLSVLLPTVCMSQATKQLPLEEALTLAHSHNNKLRADSLQYRITGVQAAEVATASLPELSVNSTFQRLSNNIKPFEIQLPTGSFAINPQILNQSYNAVQLRQLLFAGGKVNNNVKALKKEAEAGRYDYQRSALELDKQVIDLWFDLYNAKASEKIILANIEALTSTRNDQEKLRVQGIVLENDVLKIELSITRFRASLADLAAVSGTLNYNLCLSTGIDPAANIEIPESYVQLNPEAQSLTNYTSIALAQRPELQSLRLRTEAAGFRIKAAKADYLPTLSLIGSYNYDRPNQRIIPNVGAFNYSALAGLTLNWKISSFYTNHHKVNESKLTASQLDYTAIQEKENIMSEVNSLYLEYIKTGEKIALNEKEVSQAKENYRVEKNKLSAQTTTPTDFLTANAALLQAQLNLATAKANADLAYKKLIKSTGSSAK